MTQNTNFPPHLIDGFKKLADDFEAHIRADERKRIAAKIRKEFPANPVAKPQPETGLFPVTDLHGEPLQETGPQPVKEQGMSAKHFELVRWLSRGTFMAVPTLAGHLGLKRESIYGYLSVLKAHGYDIEIRSTGNRKGGYINIYRLAQSA